MKDLAELIVDLAYSAVAFDNMDIADEVKHIEERMDTLNYKVRLVAMLAARTTEDAEQLAGILQVAAATEAISNAAGDVANLLRKVETRPFFPRVLARAEEKLKQYRVPQESSIAGRTLGELDLEAETGMRLLAIRRGTRWVYLPEDDHRLLGGDSLVLRGTDNGFEYLREIAGEPPRERPGPVAGAESVPPEAARFEDLLLDMKDTSELMVDLAFSAVLYNSREIAEEVEELEQYMDDLRERAQLAALEALVANAYDPKRALGAVRLTEASEAIADSALGIADVVLRDVEPHPILALAIRESDVVITRVLVESGSTLDGKTLGEASVAAETGMWIIALKHGGRYTYGPGKTTAIVAGDILIARGPIEGEDELRDLCMNPDARSDDETE